MILRILSGTRLDKRALLIRMEKFGKFLEN